MINASFQAIYDVRHEQSLLGAVSDSPIAFATITAVPAVSLLRPH